MKRYANRSGRSGVVAYEVRPGAIVIAFRNGERYEYTQASAGVAEVAAMQALALAGEGLSTFVAQHQPGYARKL